MATQHIPSGYHTLTPSVVVDDAAKAMDFYQQAFGATETYRLPMGDKIAHAEMEIAGSRFMLSDEFPEWGAMSPKSRGGATGGMMVYVPDVDATYKKAIAGGAREIRALANQFYGDRSGTITDPFGHQWTIATHVEDVSPEEMERRMAKA